MSRFDVDVCRLTVRHVCHWLLHILLLTCVGAVLLSIVRHHPKALHQAAIELPDWLRTLAIFLASLLATYLAWNMLDPRYAHRLTAASKPPTWAAWLVALLAMAVIDLRFGLSPNVYEASILDWCLYAALPIILLVIWSQVNRPVSEMISEPPAKPPTSVLDPSNWESVTRWLTTEAPATYDITDAYPASGRLHKLLLAECESIGVIGPFGSGKTSLVKWMISSLPSSFVVVEQSCWHFERSSEFIVSVLDATLSKVHDLVDTFDISALPEAYRETFSSGKTWITRLSDLLLDKRDPLEQMKDLATLLFSTGRRLLIVVEDLDRRDAGSFSGQDVQAFLHQLRSLPNICFILTCGATEHDIDFDKLCEHVEYIPPVTARVVRAAVQCVATRCMNHDAFPSEQFASEDARLRWGEDTAGMDEYVDTISVPSAISRLLSTPRTLRHALSRTLVDWRTLHGEVNWDHLLLVNVLRIAAPSCFAFIQRYWGRLSSRPSQTTAVETRRAALHGEISEAWQALRSAAEWDTQAAEVLMKELMPTIFEWISERETGIRTNTTLQGIQTERYWRRCETEMMTTGDVSDQIVASEMRAWLLSASKDSPVIMHLCTSWQYGDGFKNLAGHLMSKDQDTLRLFLQHVVESICDREGPEASQGSLGFGIAWSYVRRNLGTGERNKEWLIAVIRLAARYSLAMVNDLWDYCGKPGQHSMLDQADALDVRTRMSGLLRELIPDARHLRRIIHESKPWSVYHLMFDPPRSEQVAAADLTQWTWLGGLLAELVASDDVLVAFVIAHLCFTSEGESSVPDIERFKTLFATRPHDVARKLIHLAPTISNTANRDLVNAVGVAALASLGQV